MLSAGYSHLNVKEAQVLYSLVLFPKAEQPDFVDTLVACFAEGQTDEQLIAKINAAFETTISASDFTAVMENIRAAHIEPEPLPEETGAPEAEVTT